MVRPYWELTMPLTPTRSSAWATMPPRRGQVAAIVATASRDRRSFAGIADALRASTTTSTAWSMPRQRSTGFTPRSSAAMPFWIRPLASTIAVVVPSPATSLVCIETSRTTCAPMFSKRSKSSISLAMVTPSRDTIGVPIGRSTIAFMPRGPRVASTAAASLPTPRASARLASPSWMICFAMVAHSLPVSAWRFPPLDGRHVVVPARRVFGRHVRSRRGRVLRQPGGAVAPGRA